MAIHGLKVDDAALQKVVDNAFARDMRKIVRAGVIGSEKTARHAIDEFYHYARSGHSYESLPGALKVKPGAIKQNSKQAWCDIEIRIDEDIYRSETQSHYRIYKWAKRKGPGGFDPAGFVIGLQWDQGIVGLPNKRETGGSGFGFHSPWPHYQGSPLKDLLKDDIDRIWKRNVNKAMKEL